MTVIGVVGERYDERRGIVAAARAGVTDFVFPSREDVWTVLQQYLVGADLVAARHAVIVAYEARVPNDAWPLFEFAVLHSERADSVQSLTRTVGIAPRTLRGRLARARLPGPKMLLAWLRLAMSAFLLERTDVTVERVAAMVGFGSMLTMKRTARRILGIPPVALRRPGSFAELSAGRLDAAGVSPRAVGR